MDNQHRDRKPRKRGFDDDYSSPPGGDSWPQPLPSYGSSSTSRSSSSMSSSSGDSTATVKWYNSEKGFGFVDVEGTGDAFLHASVIQRCGFAEVSPGDVLKVRVGPGQKGQQVTDVISVAPGTTSTQQPRSVTPAQPYGSTGEPRSNRSTGPSRDVRGTVKWYNPTKGFGFVSPTDGGKDIFVHASALTRSNVSTLTEGQVIGLQVVEGPKGPEAQSIQA